MPKWSLYDQLQECIALGQEDVAKASKYLQYEVNPLMIYVDLKPSNILLDEFFNAKLLDFGLAQAEDRTSGHQLGWQTRMNIAADVAKGLVKLPPQ
ncbi:hypothetical protein CASFOL_003536 [Castilleja foliolosa]|uniref:Protein kinase domain-containing protein n=1 Tax=Castilleja foliolosa TaxID=1961234 RepID=A0ABD3EHS1_9LAMI